MINMLGGFKFILEDRIGEDKQMTDESMKAFDDAVREWVRASKEAICSMEQIDSDADDESKKELSDGRCKDGACTIECQDDENDP